VFLRLRPRPEPARVASDSGIGALERLARDSTTPLSLRHINSLDDEGRRRVYRALLPAELLSAHGVDPVTWLRKDKSLAVSLNAEHDKNGIHLSVKQHADDPDDFICIEMADNSLNGIDLNLLLLNDPNTAYFRTDYDEANQPTQFGAVRRNMAEEARAKDAGLAPAQTRQSLGGSRLVMQHIEQFLAVLGQRAYFVEPLTYASAWVFEKRGFAYMRGHKLMDDIESGFQPGGPLHAALDGATPFRQRAQWNTVRGRAWAIHDGVLAAIGETWNGLRMVKQLGRNANIQTFGDAQY
jgi:hypothetical protein